MTDRTIDYYNKHAEAFCAGTIDADMHRTRARFLAYLTPGQKILDAGCGSGRDILAFRAAGYEVDAIDASAELCRIASLRTGVNVRQQRFEEIDGQEQYDGIWACASLLHVKKETLPDVLTRLRRLLKKGGVLYVSFKYGTREREKDGRYFCDLTEETLATLLAGAGFSLKEMFITEDVRKGHEDEKWVNALAGKKPAADGEKCEAANDG